MKKQRIIEYAHKANSEQLKPFLFWMILAAMTFVVAAIVIGWDPYPVHALVYRFRHYFR